MQINERLGVRMTNIIGTTILEAKTAPFAAIQIAFANLRACVSWKDRERKVTHLLLKLVARGQQITIMSSDVVSIFSHTYTTTRSHYRPALLKHYVIIG